MSTAISPWIHQFSSEWPRLRPVSTWMGDRLGIQVAVDLLRGRSEFFWSIWNNQSVFKADAPNCWNLICHTGLRVCLNDQAYTAWIHFLRGVYHKSSSEDCKLSCWPMKVAKSSEFMFQLLGKINQLLISDSLPNQNLLRAKMHVDSPKLGFLYTVDLMLM